MVGTRRLHSEAVDCPVQQARVRMTTPVDGGSVCIYWLSDPWLRVIYNVLHTTGHA